MAPLFARTTTVPAKWIEGLTLPGEHLDAEPPWHEAELFRLFDRHGIECFEPLEIWYLPSLRAEFRRRTGRSPQPDRSHIRPMPARLRRFGGRVLSALKRRVSR
jgi:hypothetical protein